MKKFEKYLNRLFEDHFSEKVEKFELLPVSGSNRKYFRIKGTGNVAIGTYNADLKENMAFINFSRHFKKAGMPVPEIYAENLAENVYLQEDLGDTTLFDHLINSRDVNIFPGEIVQIYKKVIKYLVQFQTQAGKEIDYTFCYPRARFDKQSMMWDLNYFKYYFLKLAQIPFDEQKLEDDYQRFTDYLLAVDSDFFLYRDFQSRNVILVHDDPYFIDYQGCRKGALQYDLASLLFDAKADIPQNIRDELLQYYIEELKKHLSFDEKTFVSFYYGFVLIRIMQAMGAYGFRGFYERKIHFLKSIPYAMKNMQFVLQHVDFPVQLPELIEVLQAVSTSGHLQNISKDEQDKLCIEINSFSYKKGLPVDKTEHGGGFVFDCRPVHNPGRYEKYQHLSGKDEAVQLFFKEQSDMDGFLRHVFQLVDMSVEKYLLRNFYHLQVNFGCTGGQHRSVYCAEALAAHLLQKYEVDVDVHHRERETGED